MSSVSGTSFEDMVFRIQTAGNFEEWRSTSGALVAASVAVRIVAALVLLVGPWTDQASELAGWDVERFAEIATADAKPWSEIDVEYPPASVAVFEAVTATGSLVHSTPVVGAHRVLIVAMLICDLLSAVLLGRHLGFAAARNYLLIGLPLVPMGLLRLDLLTTFLAVAAVTALHGRRDGRDRFLPEGRGATLLSSAALVAAAAIKLWPAVLVAPLWLLGRKRTAVATVLGGGVAAAVWLWWADAGLDPVDQVLTLRGATGWHVEATAGLLTSLAKAATGTAADPVLELNAFRIGTISPLANGAGQLVTTTVLALLAFRATRTPDGTDSSNPAKLAAVVLGTLGVLLATAPLFSPQFMLWLTPWAAMVAGHETQAGRRCGQVVFWLTAGACTITGAVLAIFGPADVVAPIAAVLLLARNGLVAALPVACWFWMSSLRSQLTDGGASPGFELPDSNVDQVSPEANAL